MNADSGAGLKFENQNPKSEENPKVQGWAGG
jgi:hypothetical protein